MSDAVRIILSIISFIVGLALLFGVMAKFGFDAPALLSDGIASIKQVLASLG